MKVESPVVSVIVPVYNREQYIGRCIESIVGQSYTDIELILIDDGSTDLSGGICQEYALKDERVTYIKKRNEGAGFARNTGMDLAKGDFLFFVDSDDFLHKDCLRIMVEMSNRYKADIVKCGYERGSQEYFGKTNDRNHVVRKNNIDVFRSREMNIAVWGKLYRKEIVSDIRYPKETLYDDEFFTYKCIYNAKNIVLLSKNLYYNYMSEQSITRSKRSKMPVNVILKAYRERIRYFNERKEEELAGISYKELAVRLMLFYSSADEYENSSELKKNLYAVFQKHYRIACKYAVYGKEKISIIMFYFMPNITAKILKMVGVSN